MKELLLRSPSATRALGHRLGQILQPFDFIALTGDLGVGKTLLVKAVAQGAGAPEATSPTFSIVNLYPGRILLQHLDLYRISGPDELFALGFDDLLREEAATLCEWADRAASALPADRLEIALDHAGAQSRKVRLSARGPRSLSLLEDLGA
jgi:tRNA threonylcarbamoyladenosine biosynthesis protein TsaE